MARKIIEIDYKKRVDRSILKGEFYDGMGYALESICRKYQIKDVSPKMVLDTIPTQSKAKKKAKKTKDKKNPFTR